MKTWTVYTLRGKRDVLYVGCSAHGIARIAAHRSRDFWLDVRTVAVEHYTDQGLALRREAALIAELNPLHNRDPGRPHAPTAEELAARAEDLKEQTHYRHPTGFRCTCCHRVEVWVPKGLRIEDAVCKACGVKALVALDTPLTVVQEQSEDVAA